MPKTGFYLRTEFTGSQPDDPLESLAEIALIGETNGHSDVCQ